MSDDNLDAAWDIALQNHKAGRLDEAEAFYRSVLDRTHDDPEALNLLGVILHDRGNTTEAISLLQRAVDADPEFPDPRVNLARVLTLTGQPEAAAAHARRAATIDPSLAEAHLQLGHALIALHDYAAAVAACATVVSLAPDLLEGHINLAVGYLGLQNQAAAIQAFRYALRLDPNRAATLTTLGQLLSEHGDHADAITILRRAVTQAPLDIAACAALAMAYTRAQQPAAAAESLRIALQRAPERADLWTRLGSNLNSLGQFDEAANCHRRALDADPNAHESRRELLLFRCDSPGETAPLIAALANQATPIADRVTAGFALGEQCDSQGDFDRAFAYFAEANRLARSAAVEKGKRFDRLAFTASIDEQIANFPASLFQRTASFGNPSELPVFIVGMPRSGTSLIEQIAASHSAVFGAGEREDIARSIERLNADRANDGKSQWRAAAVRAEADAHIARLQALGGSARRVIDKMPDNILTLGQIAVLFPNARIILARRDLRDVGLSCFSKRFTDGLSWTSDLSDIAFRATQVERLVTHWRAVLPLRIVDLDYQMLVANLEAESRRLIAFLGLDWEAACVAFHQTEREVLTASRWQVRQPLYSSSVGRWRPYRHHLGPLLAGLEGLVPPE